VLGIFYRHDEVVLRPGVGVAAKVDGGMGGGKLPRSGERDIASLLCYGLVRNHRGKVREDVDGRAHEALESKARVERPARHLEGKREKALLGRGGEVLFDGERLDGSGAVPSFNIVSGVLACGCARTTRLLLRGNGMNLRSGSAGADYGIARESGRDGGARAYEKGRQ
jgi:hypothetical protein